MCFIAMPGTECTLREFNEGYTTCHDDQKGNDNGTKNIMQELVILK